MFGRFYSGASCAISSVAIIAPTLGIILVLLTPLYLGYLSLEQIIAGIAILIGGSCMGLLGLSLSSWAYETIQEKGARATFKAVGDELGEFGRYVKKGDILREMADDFREFSAELGGKQAAHDILDILGPIRMALLAVAIFLAVTHTSHGGLGFAMAMVYLLCAVVMFLFWHHIDTRPMPDVVRFKACLNALQLPLWLFTVACLKSSSTAIQVNAVLIGGLLAVMLAAFVYECGEGESPWLIRLFKTG